MRNFLAALSAACAILLTPIAEAADQTVFQVVPQGGIRLGGNFEDAETGADRQIGDAASFGIGLEWRVGDENRWWQLWYSRQGTDVRTADGAFDLNVEYLHIGGTAPISDEGRVHSYVSGGIGATRFSPAGAGLQDATKFSASLGIGLSMPLSERVALRVEARGYVTAMEADTAIFCRSDSSGGACEIIASGKTLFQGELTVGVAFGF
jgi:opacity protein-like surface antigen